MKNIIELCDVCEDFLTIERTAKGFVFSIDEEYSDIKIFVEKEFFTNKSDIEVNDISITFSSESIFIDSIIGEFEFVEEEMEKFIEFVK